MTAPRPDDPPAPPPESEATAEDLERARVAWERASLPQHKHLLDAEPENPKEPT